MPNVPVEQNAKQIIRANTRPGANSYWNNVLQTVNAAWTEWGLYRLVVQDNASNFGIVTSGGYGTQGPVAGANASVSGVATTVGELVELFAFNTTYPSGITPTVIGAGSTYLGGTTTDIIFNTALGTTNTPWFVAGAQTAAISAVSGTTIVFSGFNYSSGAPVPGNFVNLVNSSWTTDYEVPQVVTVTSGANLIVRLTTTSGLTVGTTVDFAGATLVNVPLWDDVDESVPYPNYVGTPYAPVTWVDDATVHAYQVLGGPGGSIETTTINQYQVRQIDTNTEETQILAGYFAQYQSNLDQTQQKNTKQQQC